MDKQALTSLLNNVSNLRSISSADLEKVVEKHPYFEVGQLMLVKKYQEEKHVAFNNQLEKASIYASNRSHLFQFINEADMNVSLVEAGSEEQDDEKTAITVTEELVNQNQELSVLETEAEIQEDKVDEIESKEHHSISEIETISDHSEELLETVSEDENEEITVVSPVEENIEVAENEEQPNEPDIPAEEVIEIETDHSFSEWLKVLNDQHVEIEKPKAKKKDVLDAHIEMESNAQFLQMEEPATLDEFLEKNISRKHEASDEINVSELAKHSVEPHDDLVSETLAKLLVLQKKYDHATEVYQKLGLKYPEKSSYFAIRIEEIKKLR